MDFASTPISWIIFVITIGISLYTLYRDNSLIAKLILVPYNFYHKKDYLPIVTNGFIHADIMHLAFNMFTFYFFAFTIERVLGSLDFVIIYFASLILSSISTIIKNKDNPRYASLGASGAISGVVFASVLINPNASLMIFPVPIPIPAYIFAVIFLAWSYFASKNSNDAINHEAHYWGALAGVVIPIILKPDIIPHFINQLF